MLNLIAKVFGGKKSEKDIKNIQPIVDKINEIYSGLHTKTDDEIKAKTDEFKKKINDAVADLENRKSEIQTKLVENSYTHQEVHAFYDEIKEIDNEIFEVTEDVLNDILPEAFAVVKDVCRRLTEAKHSYEYVGNHNVWNMIPYDVQLIGAIVIHQGKIAEMQTGEGKTLVSIMPMYLNALAGKGLHLVTVNDYLAKRDCEWMKPVFDFLGITVGSIEAKMNNAQRKEIYNRDITYGTNNEFGFDYLRDNMVVDQEHMVQRGHWFSIVDEIDSVLVDEARTPLIISGPVGKTDQIFDNLKPRVSSLVNAQTKLVNSYLKEAQDLLKSDKKEDREKAGVLMLKASRGLPKHRRLLKMMQEPEIQKLKHQTELDHMRDQGQMMREIDDNLYYTIDEKNHQIDLQEKGRELLSGNLDDKDTYLLPDITAQMSEIEGNSELSEEEKEKQKMEVNRIYAERSDTVHTVLQLLRAYSLYEKDIDYVVQDGKVQIVDEHTGRVLDGRRYSEGLHQAIEAKENVKVERDTQTLATITLQNYYRLYNKLAGMTGTAETEEAEFDKIYGLEVVVIPTNVPIQRDDKNDLIFKTKREKYNALIDEVVRLTENGQAVLVGTPNVEVSEILDKLLTRRKIKHNVLNAKQHAREADIVASAGKKGAITIATNMAGRGTDIKIDPDVKKNGGLAILGSERHDSRRIDRQLRGRSGRQGDPGSSQFYISLEDNLIRLFGAGGDRIASVMEKLNIPEGEAIEHNMITKSVEKAQKKVEENNFAVRKRLIDYDDVMNQQREVVYTRRKQALRGDRLKGEFFEYIEDMASDWYQEYTGKEEDITKELTDEIRAKLLLNIEITNEQFQNMTEEDFVQEIINAAEEFYKKKEELTSPEFMKQLEKVAALRTIDEKWKEHLRVMDELKEGIHLRSYGQKDPLLEYKSEAYNEFIEFIKEVNEATVHFAFKYFPQVVEREVKSVDEKGKEQTRREQRLVLAPSDVNKNVKYERRNDVPQGQPAGVGAAAAPTQQGPQGSQATTVRNEGPEKVDIGRNDRITVKYQDGKVVKDVKYKKVMSDIENGLCQVIDK
ncbi:MAG: preprotein translocase subunit SecA [Chlorobiota bacterium]